MVVGMKSKTKAVLLAFFLGGFGAHKFYLGEPKRGIVRLIFFWTSIPFIIASWDALEILMMSKNSFEDKYCDK